MLYVVSTPIGNLGDLSPRAADALKSVDTVLAEDTRVTRKLLNHIDAHPKVERFDDHTAYAKTPGIVDRIIHGEKIGIVSDAGTPGISDPGQALIDAVLDAGEPSSLVTVIPGPSAVIGALTASGLPADTFYFGGFLPRKPAQIKAELERLGFLDTSLIFYESPKRIAKTLGILAEIMPDRRAAIIRELTKRYEEVTRATLAELAVVFGARDSIKGEIVLVIAPVAVKKEPRVHVDKYGG